MKGEFFGRGQTCGEETPPSTPRRWAQTDAPSRPSGALGRFIVRAFAALVMDHAVDDLLPDPGVGRPLGCQELPRRQSVRGCQSLHRFEPDLLLRPDSSYSKGTARPSLKSASSLLANR